MGSSQGRASAGTAQEVRELAAALSAQVRWLRASGAIGVPAASADSAATVARIADALNASPVVDVASVSAIESVSEIARVPEIGRVPEVATVRSAARATEGARSAPIAAPASAKAPARAMPVDLTSVADLAALRDAIGDCQRCSLSESRTQIVFGVGNPQARLVFVGEAPGREEDRKGEPFVGAAGGLLTDIIEKGMRLTRADVYICNVVKCRPPGNRDPEPTEVSACAPFLAKQIELIAPEVIVALGRVAAQSLLGTSDPISGIRGRWLEYRGIPLMPTLHPAYLLRNPDAKRLVWDDIKQVMTRLGMAR